MNLQNIRTREDFPQFLTANGYCGQGVEVGVYRGAFSNQILAGWRGKLTGIDCYNHGTEFSIMVNAISVNMEYIHGGRYKIIVSDSLEAVKYIESGLDFVFLDAEHSYDAVRKEIAAFWGKIRSGGILCGHDYDASVPGVSRAVNEWSSGNKLIAYIKPCSSWFIQKP